MPVQHSNRLPGLLERRSFMPCIGYQNGASDPQNTRTQSYLNVFAIEEIFNIKIEYRFTFFATVY